jgi:hypothetical protein
MTVTPGKGPARRRGSGLETRLGRPPGLLAPARPRNGRPGPYSAAFYRSTRGAQGRASADQGVGEVDRRLPGRPGALGRPLSKVTGPHGRRRLGCEPRPVGLKPASIRTMTLPFHSRGELAPAARADQRRSSPASPSPLAASARTVRPVEQQALMSASKAPNRHRRTSVSIRTAG